MAAELDELVESFRSRPLDGGPYPFVWLDALTQKVREGGRTANVHALIATGVNAAGYREILGIDVASSEDGAAWQRCRTPYHRNLLTKVPKSAQPWVPALVRTTFEQPDAASVRAQHAHVALEAKLPQAAAHLDQARDDITEKSMTGKASPYTSRRTSANRRSG